VKSSLPKRARRDERAPNPGSLLEKDATSFKQRPGVIYLTSRSSIAALSNADLGRVPISTRDLRMQALQLTVQTANA
jgi:hypothetical protein